MKIVLHDSRIVIVETIEGALGSVLLSTRKNYADSWAEFTLLKTEALLVAKALEIATRQPQARKT